MEQLIQKLLQKVEQQNNQLQLVLEGQQRGIVKDVLTTKDACWYLSCCDNQLRKYVTDGKLKRYPLGKKDYYYKVEDLRAMFSNN